MSDRKKFFEKIKSGKGVEFLVAGIAAVCILVLAFGGNCSASGEKAEEGDSYVVSLETRLKNTLSGVKGAGRVSVAIAVSGSKKTIIASEKTTVKNDGGVTTTDKPLVINGKTVVLGESYPEITGVIIVSSGADKPSVRINLTVAAAVLLDIDESKIQILKGK